MSPTRRTLLTTAALSLGGGALAGCLGGSVPTGDATPDETAGAPTDRDGSRSDRTSSPEFARWLPDPRNTPLRDGYAVEYFDATAIRERRNDLHENAYERLEAEMLDAGPGREYVDGDAVTASLALGFDVSIAFGSFDPDGFRATYARRRAGSETASTATVTAHAPETPTPERYAGFDLYGTNRVYAVSEDAIVEVGSFSGADPLERARAIVDAPSGETSAYADGNEYVRAMLGLVDEPHALKCYPERMDGSMSRGFREDVITGGLRAWRFGERTTRLTFANTYPDPDAATEADFGAYIESESARFGAYDGLEIETEGRMVWTAGTVPTAEFDHLSPGGPEDGVHTPNG